jgi:GDPmannose 4,6-dehydratase
MQKILTRNFVNQQNIKTLLIINRFLISRHGYSYFVSSEKGYVISCSHPDYQLEEGSEVVAVEPAYSRPTEVDLLIGDPAKCKELLNRPPKYDLKGLLEDMVSADMALFEKEKLLRGSGYIIKNQFE